MIRSMTGYGRSQQILNGRDISVEIRSVNHRFFEFSARVPRIYGYLEEKMKSFVQGRVSRGKIDVNVTVFTVEGKESEVEINKSLAKGYVEALRELKEEFDLIDDLSLSSIARFGDIFSVRKAPEDEEVVWADVQVVAQEAVQKFVEMREAEGHRLKEDVLAKLRRIEDLVGQIETLSPQTVVSYRERLTAKMKEVLQDQNVDEQRLLLEAAIYSEKIAVDEETVRLRSHLKQFTELLETDQAVGRKLDFLVQELNRETNTIGSKAQNIEITGMVVEIKSEIEKIREQIQNIE
ncbi:YicC-like family%2C N-terminal region [uncultured Ruminococcus sp.]|uniref:YicC family protein n=1 Tax=Massiliimalia timonensis TaxID=1987501 RepID=A0A8J6TWD8_9FIRM|nr:YicC/YloC family endoribonuclease [Massiliimalia timonensis]MBC8609565.1 YicC family protein [Massiliimalia timonensis]SCH37336.1 YicC-like family%2C N-terminal region [uncultured Ruminococcus sp.]SCH39281.1 YicC-like family%2C N-terminal region [uncultured Clostridium sp.]